jgi:predicted kinase
MGPVWGKAVGDDREGRCLPPAISKLFAPAIRFNALAFRVALMGDSFQCRLSANTDRFYTALERRPRQAPSGITGPMQMRSMLIIFAGLPGAGKSSVARELAGKLDAVWLRIDSIEQAIRESGVLPGSIDDVGYRAAFAVAGDNLGLGRIVVTDSVNDWMVTRDAWRESGVRAGARVVEVEIVCSDPQEHRRRIETRASDVPGPVLPD